MKNSKLIFQNFFANPTIRNIATSLTEDTDTMKKEFLQTFSFEELQKTDVQEQAEYRKKNLQINDVEEMNSKYENILLLGSTGFLGLYLLNQLLLKSTANITLIVRAESVEQAQSRIYQQYRYYFEKDSYKVNFQRIEFLTGD